MCLSLSQHVIYILLFFFNDPPTTEIYTLSLHDALPIWHRKTSPRADPRARRDGHRAVRTLRRDPRARRRSEEHTSELQSLRHLVCRLLLEKKKNKKKSKHKKRLYQ